MNIKSLVVVAVIAISSISTAQAAQFVTGYDITNARASGFGGWSHTYSGSITSAGNDLVNYTGGSGTLNDGVVSANAASNQLFTLADNASITLRLNSPTFLSELNIFGSTGTVNLIPGTLTGATISFGGLSQAFSSTPWGPNCNRVLCNDRFSFAGTSLANIATSIITLSNFQGGWSNYFSASEISISGVAAVSPVPEPETYAMLLVGLGLMGGMARRRKQQLARA
jgi:hypothetical protein